MRGGRRARERERERARVKVEAQDGKFGEIHVEWEEAVGDGEEREVKCGGRDGKRVGNSC